MGLVHGLYLYTVMQLRFLLLFGIVFFAAGLAAQPPVLDLNATDGKGRKQGTWSKTWPTGKTRYLGQFKDDRPSGTFKHYDEEGHLTTIQEHGGDGLHSRAKHYHANGNLMASGCYQGQLKDSTWSYFGDDAKLRKVERYLVGQLHGEQVAYYPDGSVAERENRAKGVLEGASKSWFANGKLRSEATYVKDEPEGKMVFYFPNGTKEIEGFMVNGDRDGTWYYFNDDGSLQLQMLYSKGQLMKERKENGVFKEYFDDEQLKSEVIYKKGKKQGAFTEYHDNGVWELEPLAADPVLGTPGEMQRVLKGQTKQREGTYVDDLLEGEVKEYDDKGKLLKTTPYKAGVMQ